MKGNWSILLIIGVVALYAKAQEITLDHLSDDSGVWLDNSCHYQDIVEDFWVYGCPLSTPDVLDPSQYSGFWTTCQPKPCEIIYHGGFLLKPKKVTFTAYIEGEEPTIIIKGKVNPEDEQFDKELGELKGDGTTGFHILQIDISSMDITVLSFTLTNSTRGYVLLDKINVDLGDATSGEIFLDTQADLVPTNWPIETCVYSDDYVDFWTYGCLAKPSEDNDAGAVGYWSPCQEASCQIQFYSGSSINPYSMTIRSYISGTAQIRILSQPTLNSKEVEIVKILSVENVGEGWKDVDVDLTCYSNNLVTSIELVKSSDDSLVILDKACINFANGNTTTIAPCIIQTSTTLTISTGPTTPPTSTVPNKDGGGSPLPTLTNSVLLISLFVISFNRLY